MHHHRNNFFSPQLIGFLLAYFAVWTLVPTWLAGSYPLDVTEGIYWGREWQWGYHKHPPLSSWVLYGFYRAFGTLGPYLLSQLTIGLTLWLVYRLGREILPRERAVLGTALLMGVVYYSWPTLEFNHNIAQLPVWAGIIYALYLATTRNRLRDWLLFGLLAGLGMLVKYTVAILLLVALLYSLLPGRRRLWLGKGPWLGILLACLIFLPNLLWLVQNDWLPFAYASTRSAQAGDNGRLAAFGFFTTQLVNHVPLLLMLLLTGSRLRRPENRHTGLTFLFFMGLGPLLLLMVLGLVFGVGLRDMWGMPMWNLSGLLVAAMLPQERLARQYPRLLKAVAVWLLTVTVLMTVFVGWGGQIRNKPSRIHWPQAALAERADSQWQALSSCRFDNVSGDPWLAALVGTAAPSMPSVMIAGNPAYSPWMDAERIRRHGSLMVWAADEAPPEVPLLMQVDGLPDLAVSEGEWQIAWNKMPSRPPLAVKWRAYLPPDCRKPQP